MRTQLVISSLLLIAAFVAGRMSLPSSQPTGSSRADEKKRELPTKVAERPASGDRETRQPAPSDWKILRERASRSREELMEEMLTNLVASPNYWIQSEWLSEHLLQSDPKGTFERIKKELGRMPPGLVSQWCTFDPERALPLLLAEPMERDDFGSRFSSLHFQGMGARDPEKGLAMIRELPPNRRKSAYFATLLGGIAASAPEQAFGYFEGMVKDGFLPDKNLSEVMHSLAAVAPTQLLAWVESREDPLPQQAKSEMIQGLASSDLEAAKRLYLELPGEGKKSAGYYIATQLGRSNSDLAACLGWIEAHAPEGDWEYLKDNSVSIWAYSFPDQITERMLSDPWLLDSRRASELINNLKEHGRGEELLGVLEKLEGDRAEEFRKKLGTAGVIEETQDDFSTLDRALARITKDPGGAGELWQSLDEEKKSGLLMQASNMSQTQPPELLLKITEGMSDQATENVVRPALARLSLMNPSKAAAYVEAMPEGDARVMAVKNVHANWATDDPEAAKAWLEKMGGGK